MKGEWRIMQSGNQSRQTAFPKSQELEYPPFPCALNRSQALAYSLSCSLVDTLLLLHILWLSHTLLLSIALILSWQYFRARVPWSILGELLIEELVGRYILPPLRASHRGKPFPSRLLQAAREDFVSAYQERVSILLLSVHWTNINRAQRTAGPRGPHSINVVVDLLAKDDRRATVSCQNHLRLSAKTHLQARSRSHTTQLNWETWSFLA